MIRYAVVGTGWIADAFIEGAALAGGLRLAAVYSRREETGRAFAQKYGDIPVWTDLEALAASKEIDAVYIASPNVLHYPQSRLFLEHGKHVLCEKPITVTARQLRELSALAAERGLVYLEAIMMRHLPARTVLKEAAGRLGTIRSARFDFSQLSSKYAALRAGGLPNIFNPAMATGGLMDLGIYCVYPALDLFGRPERIDGTAVFHEGGADAAGSCQLRYPDKVVTLTYSKTAQSRIGSEILGDEGTLVIDSISQLTGMRLIRPDGTEERLIGERSKAELMSGEAAAFRRFIETHAAAAGAESAARSDYADAAALSLAVCETMEAIRQNAGIRFADDAPEVSGR